MYNAQYCVNPICTNGVFFPFLYNGLGLVHYISRGHRLNFKMKLYFFRKLVFFLANSVEPDELQCYVTFLLGLHRLPKYAFWSHWYYIQSVYLGHILKTCNYVCLCLCFTSKSMHTFKKFKRQIVSLSGANDSFGWIILIARLLMSNFGTLRKNCVVKCCIDLRTKVSLPTQSK